MDTIRENVLISIKAGNNSLSELRLDTGIDMVEITLALLFMREGGLLTYLSGGKAHRRRGEWHLTPKGKEALDKLAN